jgi:glycosyltransferase involved in cell wall biosynthesis
MNLSPADITIAVTVFNRRQFLKQAIASALEQTMPARVIVVEDCGPDPGMKTFVRQQFGARIEYFRNAKQRGLFGNWNSCLDYCRTPWISILHDDDYVAPGFIEAMVELSQQAPRKGLYFGQTTLVNEAGVALGPARAPMTTPWRPVELRDVFDTTPFPFPGHIFQVGQARERGGFRVGSQFCGDWEMWCNLIAHYGAAQTSALVAFNRAHEGFERGTKKIDRNGRLRPLSFVQQKRIIRLLREQGAKANFDRNELLRKSPMSVSELIRLGGTWSPRMLRYNLALLARSKAPSTQYAIFQALAGALGVPFVKSTSWLAGHTGLDRYL